jgi:hypothetical protein
MYIYSSRLLWLHDVCTHADFSCDGTFLHVDKFIYSLFYISWHHLCRGKHDPSIYAFHGGVTKYSPSVHVYAVRVSAPHTAIVCVPFVDFVEFTALRHSTDHHGHSHGVFILATSHEAA